MPNPQQPIDPVVAHWLQSAREGSSGIGDAIPYAGIPAILAMLAAQKKGKLFNLMTGQEITDPRVTQASRRVIPPYAVDPRDLPAIVTESKVPVDSTRPISKYESSTDPRTIQALKEAEEEAIIRGLISEGPPPEAAKLETVVERRTPGYEVIIEGGEQKILTPFGEIVDVDVPATLGEKIRSRSPWQEVEGLSSQKPSGGLTFKEKIAELGDPTLDVKPHELTWHKKLPSHRLRTGEGGVITQGTVAEDHGFADTRVTTPEASMKYKIHAGEIASGAPQIDMLNLDDEIYDIVDGLTAGEQIEATKALSKWRGIAEHVDFHAQSEVGNLIMTLPDEIAENRKLKKAFEFLTDEEVGLGKYIRMIERGYSEELVGEMIRAQGNKVGSSFGETITTGVTESGTLSGKAEGRSVKDVMTGTEVVSTGDIVKPGGFVESGREVRLRTEKLNQVAYRKAYEDAMAETFEDFAERMKAEEAAGLKPPKPENRMRPVIEFHKDLENVKFGPEEKLRSLMRGAEDMLGEDATRFAMQQQPVHPDAVEQIKKLQQESVNKKAEADAGVKSDFANAEAQTRQKINTQTNAGVPRPSAGRVPKPKVSTGTSGPDPDPVAATIEKGTNMNPVERDYQRVISGDMSPEEFEGNFGKSPSNNGYSADDIREFNRKHNFPYKNKTEAGSIISKLVREKVPVSDLKDTTPYASPGEAMDTASVVGDVDDVSRTTKQQTLNFTDPDKSGVHGPQSPYDSPDPTTPVQDVTPKTSEELIRMYQGGPIDVGQNVGDSIAAPPKKAAEAKLKQLRKSESDWIRKLWSNLDMTHGQKYVYELRGQIKMLMYLSDRETNPAIKSELDKLQAEMRKEDIRLTDALAKGEPVSTRHILDDDLEGINRKELHARAAEQDRETRRANTPKEEIPLEEAVNNLPDDTPDDYQHKYDTDYGHWENTELAERNPEGIRRQIQVAKNRAERFEELGDAISLDNELARIDALELELESEEAKLASDGGSPGKNLDTASVVEVVEEVDDVGATEAAPEEPPKKKSRRFSAIGDQPLVKELKEKLKSGKLTPEEYVRRMNNIREHLRDKYDWHYTAMEGVDVTDPSDPLHGTQVERQTHHPIGSFDESFDRLIKEGVNPSVLAPVSEEVHKPAKPSLKKRVKDAAWSAAKGSFIDNIPGLQGDGKLKAFGRGTLKAGYQMNNPYLMLVDAVKMGAQNPFDKEAALSLNIQEIRSNPMILADVAESLNEQGKIDFHERDIHELRESIHHYSVAARSGSSTAIKDAKSRFTEAFTHIFKSDDYQWDELVSFYSAKPASEENMAERFGSWVGESWMGEAGDILDKYTLGILNPANTPIIQESFGTGPGTGDTIHNRVKEYEIPSARQDKINNGEMSDIEAVPLYDDSVWIALTPEFLNSPEGASYLTAYRSIHEDHKVGDTIWLNIASENKLIAISLPTSSPDLAERARVESEVGGVGDYETVDIYVSPRLNTWNPQTGTGYSERPDTGDASITKGSEGDIAVWVGDGPSNPEDFHQRGDYVDLADVPDQILTQEYTTPERDLEKIRSYEEDRESEEYIRSLKTSPDFEELARQRQRMSQRVGPSGIPTYKVPNQLTMFSVQSDPGVLFDNQVLQSPTGSPPLPMTGLPGFNLTGIPEQAMPSVPPVLDPQDTPWTFEEQIKDLMSPFTLFGSGLGGN